MSKQSLEEDAKLHNTLAYSLKVSVLSTVGIATSIEAINPTPDPETIAAVLAESGLTEQRTAHQVELACACGYSRPVVESHIATLLSRGAGHLRYRGPHGARVQLGMTVMA